MDAAYTRPTSGTRLFVASALWAAAIVPAAWLSSQFLSIPGAFGASFFWLPQIFMVTGAIWLGPYGWLAAAVGTFVGGALAGSPLAINFAQNPVPAFLGNTMLCWALFWAFRVRVGGREEGVPGGKVLLAILAVVGSIVLTMVVGYLVGPLVGRWGYLIAFAVTLTGWVVLYNLGARNLGISRDIVLAVVAVVLSSLASAVLGAIAWATVGGMGYRGAFSIVFPGWFLGDTVAGSLGVAVLWAFDREMSRLGLQWRPAAVSAGGP
jgi:hypothetical protein